MLSILFFLSYVIYFYSVVNFQDFQSFSKFFRHRTITDPDTFLNHLKIPIFDLSSNPASNLSFPLWNVKNYHYSTCFYWFGFYFSKRIIKKFLSLLGKMENAVFVLNNSALFKSVNRLAINISGNFSPFLHPFP